MQHIEASPTFQTNGIYAPEDYGELACWGWIISDPDGEILASDAGCRKNPEFGRNKPGAKIEAIARALEWAKEHGYRNVVILTDDVQALGHITGVLDIPKRCKPNYRAILQTAREMLAQVGGHVAWSPSLGSAAFEVCRDCLIEYVQSTLEQRLGRSQEPPTGDKEGEPESSRAPETIEVTEGLRE